MGTSTRRPAALFPAALHGAAAGPIGVAAMTASEKLEQAVTHRPSSHVPARALLTLRVGAPPHTWPVREQVLDVLHKAVFSLATGVVADRLIAARLQSRRGTTSH